ncbi:glyoxylate reductase [Chaetomidium leptoderma]|uniref:Glyoxylate reductase n=1 Tax=Chaetomidium leptoderma TaxID=669021 RepID=A0AAN6VY56_9PEZI|nr:glyoxylate reductase [Chaetomidium leptoderma]
MAPQKRARQHAGDLSPESTPRAPPAKRIRTRTDFEFDAWASWEYAPEFWDRLSKIEPTRRALREFDRRTRLPRPRRPPAASNGLAQQLESTATSPRDLARFAGHGGPDLSDLRGYPPPATPCSAPAIMSSRKSSRSGGSRSANPASTQATSATTKSKKSTPYNRDFDQHLTDHGVHPLYSSEEPDLDEAISILAKPRPSLSPSQFSDGAFKTFRQTNARAKDEDDVLANVMPTILGPSHTTDPSARNTIFGNLEPLTDGTIAPAKPDIYYGANPQELLRSVRNELGHHIIPSSMHDKPMAPNYFVEVKGPDGSVAVATRQARYDGAVGSRAMHSLQNYGREQPQYDGQAYTFSSTYHDGTLKMYAHHPTAPTSAGGAPEYHMTQMKAYAMTNDRGTFVQGATAFRNSRDLAKQHRDSFIQAANTKASQEAATALQDDLTIARQLGHEEESSDDFVDCTDFPLPVSPDEVSRVVPEIDDCSHASTTLPELGDTATSLTSTSAFTADSAKRPRQPPSPDSKMATRSPPSKTRQAPGTSRQSQKPPDVGLSSADEAEHLMGGFCFRWQGSSKQTVWARELATGAEVDGSVGV